MRRPPSWCLTLWLALSMAPAALAQVPAGGEVQVTAGATGYPSASSLASDASGNFVVIWMDPSVGARSRGQRFDRAGARVGSEFQVGSSNYVLFPAVAMSGDGAFLAVWAPASNGGIHGQLFDAAGNKRGGEFQIASYTTHGAVDPTLAADGRGNFVVVWRTFYHEMEGRRVSAQGAPLGAEFQVNNSSTNSYVGFAGVSADAAGNFVVVWDGSVNNDRNVLAQRFDASGARLGDNFLVNSYTTGAQGPADVALAPDGSFVIAFSGEQGPEVGIHARRYDASGSPIGGEFQVNTTTPGPSPAPDARPQIRMDGLGGFVVAWNGSDGDLFGVKARRFFAAGTPRGVEFTVNTYTTNSQGIDPVVPALASDAAGNFVVTWLGLVGSPPSEIDVYLQRYGGLHPEALVVDSVGNRVWEPGETVDVRPRWLNVNGAAQTIGGLMPGLFGPAGAAYTIIDGQAFYSTIPNGAGAACVDCYSVAVNDAVPRPAAHWDTHAFEVVTPDAHGQVKSWRLHIGDSFSDVSSTGAFYRFVETLLHRGVTSGCGGGNYCPAASTTREQMSVFLLLAKEGAGYAPAACTTPVFGDVPASSAFCPFIEELARRGVTSGCGGGNYCPGAAVSREQMAVFVLRTLDPALNPPNCGTPVFADVPASSPFCRWIEELARRGIVSGCAPGLYCPADPVTREQMAVFLTGTFGLTLYGP